jgi:1-acyl-sn-glycerol-3-phosphate acyltransferase
MKIIRNTLATIHLIWGLFVFFSAMLLVLPFIVLAGFIFPPHSAVRVIYFFLRCWGFILTTLILQPVFVYGKRTLRKGQAYIFIANHNSYLDAPAVILALSKAAKPLGKIEMMKVPIFSIIYKKIVVLLDRRSKESRATSVIQLKKELDKGISILIFPEGTMNKTEVPVAAFYDGAFRIAIETQTPLAPYVIINARNLLPREHPLKIKPGIISCYSLDPIETKGLTLKDVSALKAQVHAQMTEAIVRYSK